ncbi:unnamed protein product [Mesocestoides corti]|uniref:EF-hand domain-containing protein n=1 Tax=Mesocestoides corti TaxID=53468 RepID=A0A0R3UQE2_MESCO|nr:unnamed protein product [Mesocestoides corti]
MASDSHIFETLTKLDNLSSAFRTVTNAHHHSNDSSLLLDSESPADDQIIRRIQSADQLVGLSDVNRASSQHRPTSLTLSSSGKGSSTFSSPTSGDADAPESPQYTKFGESPFRESVDLSVSGTSGDPSSLEQMLSSIPRRREFAEQFLDLAQLHQQEDAPRAKWDDASRLFPKQFGLSSSVAINIWKQVDSDGDLMLTEAEYCLAAHLAEKYSSTGFSLLEGSPVGAFRSGGGGGGGGNDCRQFSSAPSTHQQRQHDFDGLRDDESHDFLLSPVSVSIVATGDSPRVGRGSALSRSPPASTSSFSNTPHKRKTNVSEDETFEFSEDEEAAEPKAGTDDDDDVDADDDDGDETGVRALLPVRRVRLPLGGGESAALLSRSSSAVSSSAGSSNSSTADPSASSSGSYDSSSSPLSAVQRNESVCSVSESSKSLDPVEVLCKFTRRSPESILSLPALRRKRQLASLVRAAKSTNYTLLRLNNELSGELQELCDQHTNLNAQVRHLSLRASIPPP